MKVLVFSSVVELYLLLGPLHGIKREIAAPPLKDKLPRLRYGRACLRKSAGTIMGAAWPRLLVVRWGRPGKWKSLQLGGAEARWGLSGGRLTPSLDTDLPAKSSQLSVSQKSGLVMGCC